MTDTGWEDYVTTDPGTAVSEVEGETEDLASAVNEDPDASLSDQIAAGDAESSAYDAATDQSLADGSEAMGDWQAQQADSWEQWAEGSAAEGLDDLAASSLANAGEYASEADSSYADAASSEGDVVDDLQATETSADSIDTSAESETPEVDTSEVDTSVDASADTSEY